MQPMRQAVLEGGVPDDELVRMVRGGAFAAFEVLMRRHAPRVHRAVRGVLRDGPDVDDAVQQAFLQAFVGIGRFEGAASFATWVARIAVNEALMRVRRPRVVVDGGPDLDAASTVA